MTSINNVILGVTNYLDNEVFDQLPANSLEKAMIGTMVGLLLSNNINKETFENNKYLKFLGVVDENGDINTEKVLAELRKNIPDAGVKIDIPGIHVPVINLDIGNMSLTFKKDDITKLGKYIDNV